MAKFKGAEGPVQPPAPDNGVIGPAPDPVGPATDTGGADPSSGSSAGDSKKRFLLRLDPAVWAGLEKWAADELRSVNGEIEFLLKEALKKAGRLR